jgi:hypothetical protein
VVSTFPALAGLGVAQSIAQELVASKDGEGVSKGPQSLVMGFDEDTWRRIIFEALRPIDSEAQFNVALLEMDFRNMTADEADDFPADELARFVDDWLETLDPDALTMLEPEMENLHFTSGGQRRFIDLTLNEIEKLAAGDSGWQQAVW